MRLAKHCALLLTLLVSGVCHAANYGLTSQGSTGWWPVETRYAALTITLPGGEPIVASYAYMRSVGTATNGCRMALYTQSTDALAHSSDVLAGFTDATGAFKTFTWPATTPSAGTYRLMVVCDAIAGGGNTAEIAYNTVGSDATNYQEYFYGVVGESWSTMGSDLTGAEVPQTTRQGSIYLETTSGGGASNAPRAMHHKRQVGHVIDFDRYRSIQRPRQYCTELRIAA